MTDLAAHVANWRRAFPVSGAGWQDPAMMGIPTKYLADLYPMTPAMVLARLLDALEHPRVTLAAKRAMLGTLASQSRHFYPWAARMDSWESSDQGELYERCDTLSRAINAEGAAIVRDDTLTIYGIGILLATGEEPPELNAAELDFLAAEAERLDELMATCTCFVEMAEALT